MKEFTCPKDGCDSKQFVLATIKQTLVDFSREGAVEGHPFLEHLSTTSGDIFCYECEEKVPSDMRQEMSKEIV